MERKLSWQQLREPKRYRLRYQFGLLVIVDSLSVVETNNPHYNRVKRLTQFYKLQFGINGRCKRIFIPTDCITQRLQADAKIKLVNVINAVKFTLPWGLQFSNRQLLANVQSILANKSNQQYFDDCCNVDQLITTIYNRKTK